MTIRTYFLAVTVLLFCNFASAQNTCVLMGSRAMALGYASACLKDEWATFNNVAGLATVTATRAAFTYHLQPSFGSFNTMAATIASRFRPGVVALGIYRFGDALYNEHLVSAAFANTFGIASLGLKVDYIQYHAEGFGTTGALSLSFGGIATLTPLLSVGAHIGNINQPRIGKATGETLPTHFTLGLGFDVSEHLFITTAIFKDVVYDLAWKAGIEYKPHGKFTWRTGVNLHPHAAFMGIAFHTKRLVLDYALQYNLNTGTSFQATAGYTFNTKK